MSEDERIALENRDDQATPSWKTDVSLSHTHPTGEAELELYDAEQAVAMWDDRRRTEARGQRQTHTPA